VDDHGPTVPRTASARTHWCATSVLQLVHENHQPTRAPERLWTGDARGPAWCLVPGDQSRRPRREADAAAGRLAGGADSPRRHRSDGIPSGRPSHGGHRRGVGRASRRAMILIDTSALAKLLVEEKESAALRAALSTRAAQGESFAISRVAVVELQRLSIRLDVAPEHAQAVLRPFHLLRLTEAMTQLAARLPYRHLGTL